MTSVIVVAAAAAKWGETDGRISKFIILYVGRDSSVGIATTLRAGRSGDRIPVEARFSAHLRTGPGAHPYTKGTGYLSRV